ncbi:unnamed protein product, partial [Rotaria sp. Silwood2]
QHQQSLAPQIPDEFGTCEEQNVVFNEQQRQIYLNNHNHKNIPTREQLQLQPNASTPNKRRLNDSAGSGGPPTPKQQRSGNNQAQLLQEESLAQSKQPSANIPTNHTYQNKIPFDQIKRAVSSNLPCFYVVFNRSTNTQQIPSAFNIAEKIVENLKQEGVQMNRFTFVGWAGTKLKLGVNSKEDYIKLVSTDKWPTKIMDVPMIVQKPKFIPDCFAFVIRYVPRGMDHAFVKEEISKSVGSIDNVKRIQYGYTRKMDDYRFNVKDFSDYDRTLSMGRISIGNIMLPITSFLQGNKITYCTRCWCIGHLRDKCQASSARCRICLQEIAENQTHICSYQPRCAQCDGNHHSLSSQCQPIRTYKAHLKEEVDKALSSGILRRLEPPKQTSEFNSEDFPAITDQAQRIIPVWGNKHIPQQQSTFESANITNALTALTKQLTIMTDNNLRMEKKLDETNDVMAKIVYPLCELKRVDPVGKYLPFSTILDELTADTNMDRNTLHETATAKSTNDTVTSFAVDKLNNHET